MKDFPCILNVIGISLVNGTDDMATSILFKTQNIGFIRLPFDTPCLSRLFCVGARRGHAFLAFSIIATSHSLYFFFAAASAAAAAAA